MRFIPYKYRPSFGFIVVVACLVLTAAFFVWGSARPDLDLAWEVTHRLRQGETVQLTPDEQAALRRAVEKHPELRLGISPDGFAVRLPKAAEAEAGD